jgi:hypothetical protein
LHSSCKILFSLSPRYVNSQQPLRIFDSQYHFAAGVFVSFDKEFEQVSDNIAHHSTEVDWAANAANIEEAKKARGIEDIARSSKLHLFFSGHNRSTDNFGQANCVLMFRNGCVLRTSRMISIDIKEIAWLVPATGR